MDRSIDANCESGDVALSGGIYIENKNLQIPSRPKGTSGWESVTNYRVDDGPRESVDIFVLCADITPEAPQTFKPIPMVP